MGNTVEPKGYGQFDALYDAAVVKKASDEDTAKALAKVAPKPSKTVPMKQLVPPKETVKAAKIIDYSMPLLDALQEHGISKVDFETLINSKKKNRRGGYNSRQSLEILKFLALFKYATASILKNIHDVSERAVQAQMNRLIAKKQVQRITLPGVKSLFTLTPLGMELSGYDFKIISEKGINPYSIQPTLGAAYIASRFWGQGVSFVSELEIRSSIGRMSDRGKDAYKRLGGHAKAKWQIWKQNGGDSPEVQEDGAWLYALWNDGLLGAKSFHVPDLVIVRPRGEDGKANSIAVEVERTPKEVEEYTAIARNYAQDNYAFGKVIWYAATDGIAERIKNGFEAAKVNETKFEVKKMTVKDENGKDIRFRGGDFTKL